MALLLELTRLLLFGLVVGLAGSVARNGLTSLSRQTLLGWVTLVLALSVFLLDTSPQTLRETGLQTVVVVFLTAAFWVYYDGLERLGNLEAALWALCVLCLGSLSLFGVSYTLLAVLVAGGYLVRTRVAATGRDPAA